MDEHEKALADFTKTIELLPHSPVGYNNRGITYLALLDDERALRDLDKAIELGQDYAKAYFNRALVYYGQGNLAAALSNLDQAIKYSPEEPLRYNYRATLSPGRDLLLDFEKRMELTDRTVDLPAAYYWRARVYVDQGDFEQAIRDLEKANQLGPDAHQALEIEDLLEMLTVYRSHGDS